MNHRPSDYEPNDILIINGMRYEFGENLFWQSRYSLLADQGNTPSLLLCDTAKTVFGHHIFDNVSTILVLYEPVPANFKEAEQKLTPTLK
ncbi:MAG: hypothetical protein ACE5IR_21310 [bacterium]